jgi:hypothetical protein
MKEIKEEFYITAKYKSNSSDIKIILGDINAKVGNDSIYKPTLAMKVYIMRPTTTE